MAKASKKSIIVGGDFVVDLHLYEGRRHRFGDVGQGVGLFEQDGGAALVSGLVQCLVGEAYEISCTATRPSPLDPSHKAYAFWRALPRAVENGARYWRCSEAMGFGAIERLPLSCKWLPNKKLPVHPEIIVLSEGGMGFRDEPECWSSLDLESPRWIVLKTAAPVGEGAFWKALDRHCDKLFTIVSVDDLRRSQVRISSELSWEASLQDLLREMWTSSHLERLRRSRHLIVTFGSEGAAWLEFAGSRRRQCRVHFVYDAAGIEGDHAREVEGAAFGYLSCIAAAVVWQLIMEKPDLSAALYGGLSAMRDLRTHGHGLAASIGLGFPFERLANLIKQPEHAYSRAVFTQKASGESVAAGANRPVRTPDSWSILKEVRSSPDEVFDLARLTLLRGPIALSNFPHFHVGDLLTVDRQEIESLRTIAQLIRQYRAAESAKVPLSLGIFGPPGSGKSFAVSQLANALVGKDSWLEFNLSQFADGDLIGAFHQVRDRVLKGQLPVTFFDEFDAREYHWLQYLLAPMQDGKFQEGPLTHSLGKCIFIFAGATSWTFETFGPPQSDRKPSDGESEAYRTFRLAKGPDFKSRLDGYLDITGPNPSLRLVDSKGDRKGNDLKTVSGFSFITDACDLWYPIRRALMIRAKLGLAENDKLDMDDGLVSALLRTKELTHGARSLEKILWPLRAGRSGPIRRSFLGPLDQLAMHVDDAEEFLQICDRGQSTRKAEPLPDDVVGRIAPAIHETWRRLGLAAGWIKPGSQDDSDYSSLPSAYAGEKTKRNENVGEFLKRSNQAAARRMPKVLNLIGLDLEKGGPAGENEEEALRQIIEYHLDLLAEAEHYEWMQWYLDQGWSVGPKKDYASMQHPCLVPFMKLKEVDRNKDRDSIRHYLDFARAAGMRIV